MSTTQKSRPGRATEAAGEITESTTTTLNLARGSDISAHVRGGRAAELRASAAAYQHLRARGLLSEVVVAELRRLVREAAA